MIILPHGGWALIPATLATMAWMTALSLDGCDYTRLTGQAVETLTQSSTYPFVEIGFNAYRIPSFYSNFQKWEIRFNDPRIPFGEVELSQLPFKNEIGSKGSKYSMDEIINPSRGFFWSLGSTCHKIGIVFGGSAALFFWVPCLCLSYSERTWKIGGIQLIIAAFFHLLTLVWFLNSLCLERASKCHWHYGSYASVFSVLLYTASFFCVFLKYPKPIIVKIVQQRIEKELQTFERAGSRPTLSSAYGSNRTNTSSRTNGSGRTNTTEFESVVSQASSSRSTIPNTVLKSQHSRRLLL